MRMPGLMVAVTVLVVCFAVYVIMHGCILILNDDVDLGSGKAAAAHLAHLETGTHIQCCSCFFKQGKRHARIDERAKQHVAADAGEALQISDSHGNEIVPMRRVASALLPAALRSRTRNENPWCRVSRTGSPPFATPLRSGPSSRE